MAYRILVRRESISVPYIKLAPIELGVMILIILKISSFSFCYLCWVADKDILAVKISTIEAKGQMKKRIMVVMVPTSISVVDW